MMRFLEVISSKIESILFLPRVNSHYREDFNVMWLKVGK
jgi:hypothetical protein